MCHTEHLERIPCVVVRIFGSIASRILVRYSRIDGLQLHRESNANNIIDVSKHKNLKLDNNSFHFHEFNSNWTTMVNGIFKLCYCMKIKCCRTDGMGDGCKILNWNYTDLGLMNYDDAMSYSLSHNRPDTIPCMRKTNNFYHYVQEPGSSIVPEVSNFIRRGVYLNLLPINFFVVSLQWNLICENSFWRTAVAVAVSLGKFIGATSFGILSDKYGRKKCFIIGSLFYVTGSVLTSFSPWYWIFLIGRVLLGSSSSGLFYPAFSLCK